MEHPNHKIDEIFRQRLHDSEVPPPPFVWPAVEHELLKRRRRWVLWFFAFGSLAVSVWLWQSKAMPATEMSLDSSPSVERPLMAAETLFAQQPEMSPQNAIDPVAATEIISPTPSSDPVFSAKSKGAASENRYDQLSIRSTVGKGSSAMENENNSASKEASERVKTNDPIYASDNAETSTDLLLNPIILSGKDVSDQPLPIPQAQQVLSTQLPNKIAAPGAFKHLLAHKKPQPKLCYDFNRHPKALLIDVYAGPSLAQRTLTSSTDNQPYLNQRLATERRDVAMNAGLRASLMFNRNFLIRTGLHYDQVTEIFEFIDPTSVTYILKFNIGDPIPDTLGVQYGENYLKTYNRYAMLDIPLLVGVEMRHGRSGFSINAGVSANVLFEKRGVIIDPATHEPARFGPVPDKPKNIGPKATLSQEVFRRNLGLSATASIQWYWHLAPHFRVFAEPTFRQVLRPISVGSHPVEHRYSILGLRLGATKIF